MSSEHLTDRDTEAIRLYVEERLALKEVGARLGLSVSTVRAILQRAGVSRRRKGPRWGKWTQRNQEIIRAYGEQGLALEEVGRRFDLSPSTVFYVLQKAGVTRRRPGRPSAVLARRKQEIIRAYVEEGLSVGQVAARFGVSESTVRQILKKAGVGRRARPSGPPEHLKERSDEIARLYAEGDLTLREIGERFNLSHERVRQIAKRAGVTPRVLSERLKKRNQEIIRLYGEGLKLKAIGARFGVSSGSVSSTIARAGVRRRLGSAEDRWKRNQEITRLYAEEGLSLSQVGARVGLTHGHVREILESAGVSRRTLSGPRLSLMQRNQEIARLYREEGLTYKEIGARTNLGPHQVYRILKGLGVPGGQRGSGKALA